MHAFWLVLTYDLLEDKRIDYVIIKTFFNSLLYKTNRFQLYFRAMEHRASEKNFFESNKTWLFGQNSYLKLIFDHNVSQLAQTFEQCRSSTLYSTL